MGINAAKSIHDLSKIPGQGAEIQGSPQMKIELAQEIFRRVGRLGAGAAAREKFDHAVAEGPDVGRKHGGGGAFFGRDVFREFLRGVFKDAACLG